MTNGRVKGDLFVGNNVYANGEELATNTALTDGLASKLDLAGGKILQIVRATDSTDRATTSTSYVDVTGMSVTITPQYSDSAILVSLTGYGLAIGAVGVSAYARFQITDSSNNALSGAEAVTIGSLLANTSFYHSLTVLGHSTPATTSAVTYKARFRVDSAGQTASLVNAEVTGQIYAIEVSA